MLDGNENKKCNAVSKNVRKKVLNWMTIENACLAAEPTEKLMSLEVIFMRFLLKKLTKLLSLSLSL